MSIVEEMTGAGRASQRYSSLCRLLSTGLQRLVEQGVDVKALRAFRVLRPLRLVSGLPSEYN